MWWPETRAIDARLRGAWRWPASPPAASSRSMATQTAAGGAGIGDRLSSVEVAPIDAPNGTRLARVGVEVRNDLIFDLTGGGAAAAANYKLDIRLTVEPDRR